MKTIDGDALMQALEKEKTDTLDGLVRFGIAKCIDIVRNAPAIEERPKADYQDLMANIKPQDCENCAHCIPAGSVSFCELPECDFEALGGDENERLSGNS